MLENICEIVQNSNNLPLKREGPMFEKILYPTDFSNVAKNALDFIKTLENADKKEVIVLHVIDANMMEFSSRYAPELFVTIAVSYTHLTLPTN